MNRQAYDEKNKGDYEEYSNMLSEALLNIQNNKKLKPTIAQLSKMTGIHRNTIALRIWPSQKLDEIKKTRKIEAKKIEAKSLLSSIDKKALLEGQLDQARKEVVYWFNEFQDMKRFFTHSDQRFNQAREARDYYNELYNIQKKKLLAAEIEIERLRDLLKLR
jgi:hypothetical protein